MRKVFLLAAFFLLTPFVLALTLSLFTYNSFQKNAIVAMGRTPRVAFAALPAASGTLKVNITSQDARLVAVKDFFKKYHSDLLPYADEVINSADKYGLNWKLVPAIAMQESGGCKNAPKGSYNCWGLGIYAKKVTKFNNYSQAIDRVTEILAKQYKAKGLETPEQIMAKYTPGSNGSWARGVNYFMNQLAINL